MKSLLDPIRVLNSNARCKEANQPIAGHQVHPRIEMFLLHQQFDERKKEVSPLLALKEQWTCITVVIHYWWEQHDVPFNLIVMTCWHSNMTDLTLWKAIFWSFPIMQKLPKKEIKDGHIHTSRIQSSDVVIDFGYLFIQTLFSPNLLIWVTTGSKYGCQSQTCRILKLKDTDELCAESRVQIFLCEMFFHHILWITISAS